MFKNKTNLVSSTALIRTKHNNVRGCVGEFLTMKLLVLLKELQVSTTTLKAV
jgi:hypothetical protein